MHSPQDRTVAIENAARIYHVAMHPKSFISLDGADHLLSDKKDAAYAGDMIASWARRYLDIPAKEALRSDKEVVVRLGENGYTTEIMVRKHNLVADEPESVGGNDFGPSPYELVTGWPGRLYCHDAPDVCPPQKMAAKGSGGAPGSFQRLFKRPGKPGRPKK